MPSPKLEWSNDFPAEPGLYWLGWVGSAHKESCYAVDDGRGMGVRRHGYRFLQRKGDLPPETRFMGPLREPQPPRR